MTRFVGMTGMNGLADMHCHIIPGVDDGAKDPREAMQMLKLEYEEGVRIVILTPHYRIGMFETSAERIHRQFAVLKEKGEAAFPGLKLYLGCEHHANMEMVEQIRCGRCATMAGSHYVLIEFSGNDTKSYVRDRLNMLLFAGYQPIIAHAERYRCFREQFSFLEEAVSMGAMIQLNGDSIKKGGFAVKRFCSQVMKNDLLHFVGSDGHGIRQRVPHLKMAYDAVNKKMGQEYADQIFIKNPQKILLDVR